MPAGSVNGQRQYDEWQSVTLIKQQRQKIRGIKPGSVAVNHGGLWIPRQQFESAPGYFFSGCFLKSEGYLPFTFREELCNQGW